MKQLNIYIFICALSLLSAVCVCVCVTDTDSRCLAWRRGRGGVLLSGGEEDETCTDDGLWEGSTDQRSCVSTLYYNYY